MIRLLAVATGEADCTGVLPCLSSIYYFPPVFCTLDNDAVVVPYMCGWVFFFLCVCVWVVWVFPGLF